MGAAATRLRLSRTCGNLTRHGRSGRRRLIGGEARLRLEASGARGHHAHCVLRVHRLADLAHWHMVAASQRAGRWEARSDDAECPDAPDAPLGSPLKESSGSLSASDPRVSCISGRPSPGNTGFPRPSGRSRFWRPSDRMDAETLSPDLSPTCVSASRTVAGRRISSRRRRLGALNLPVEDVMQQFERISVRRSRSLLCELLDSLGCGKSRPRLCDLCRGIGCLLLRSDAAERRHRSEAALSCHPPDCGTR